MFAILMACVYEVDSCVQGYHVYQDTWTPLVGEELHCEREEENIHDRYAVVVMHVVLVCRCCIPLSFHFQCFRYGLVSFVDIICWPNK